MASACCPPPASPGGEHAALEAVAAELDAELAGDPTLQGCCRQDLEDQATAARLRAQLSLKDPSRERQRLAAQVIRAPPPGAGAGSDLESDDEDAALGRLRAERLRQLQAAAAAKAALQSQGRGAVTSVPEDRLLDAAERCGCPAVCHLAVEGSGQCDALDEHLATLAHRYLGTAFMRTLLPPRSRLHLRLRALPGPGLACFRGGALVGVLAAYGGGGQEEGGAMREEEVDAALRALRMLREEGGGGGGGGEGGAAAASQRPGAASAASSEGEDEEGGAGGGGGWCEPCEECGRRYPHQHMRTMYTERDGGGGSSSDDEGG